MLFIRKATLTLRTVQLIVSQSDS